MDGKSRHFLPQVPSTRYSLFVPRVVFYLGVDGNLYVESAVVVILDVFALGVKDAALAVAVNLDALLANFTDGIGLVRVRVDVENRVGGVGRVRAGDAGASSAGVGTRVGTRESTTSNEGTANGENYAHGHGGGQNGSHARLQFRIKTAPENVNERDYLVTMVLTASSGPVGVMMNQNKTLAMLTIQMDY